MKTNVGIWIDAKRAVIIKLVNNKHSLEAGLILAIENNLLIRNVAEAIIPYPTYSEINKRVAGQFYADLIGSSKVKFIIKLLNIF